MGVEGTTGRVGTVNCRNAAFGFLVRMTLAAIVLSTAAVGIRALPASALASIWYAYPGGTSASPSSCPQTAVVANECSLPQALTNALDGDTVVLEAGMYVPASNAVFAITTSITLQGQAGTTVLQGNGAAVLTVGPSTTVTISGIEITGGSTTGGTGGLSSQGTSLTLIDTEVDHNSTINGYGGGIFNYPGTLTLLNSTVADNSATYGGGGIYSGTCGSAVVAIDSTFAGNSGSSGGAIYNQCQATIESSTFMDNSAASGPDVFNYQATMTSTGGLFADGCTLNSSSLVDDGYNADPDGSCTNSGPGDTTSATVAGDLGSLTNNGGPTPTVRPTSGNAALTLIPASTSVTVNASPYVLCPTTDQRGAVSLAGHACDAGAVQTSGLFTPSTPTISNLPSGGSYGGGLTATVSTNGDGVKSVTSSTTSVCTAIGLSVHYVGVGQCTLTAHVAAGTTYGAADGVPQSFSVSKGAPSTPTISDLPTSGFNGAGFTATVSTNGDGVKSVTSSTTSVCTASGLSVDYVGVGQCTLTAHVTAGTTYAASDGISQSFTVDAAVAPPPSGVPTATFGSPTSQTVSGTSPTTITSTSSGTSATVIVPGGALPPGTVISVYPVTNATALEALRAPRTKDLSGVGSGFFPIGKSYVTSFAVSWQTPTGTSPPAGSMITMTIVDPSIPLGATVWQVTSSGLMLAGLATSSGAVTVTFTQDPLFMLSATPHVVIPSAALEHLGKKIPVKLHCEAARCRGTAEFVVAATLKGSSKIKYHVIATTTFNVAAGKSAVVDLLLNGRGRRVIRSAHHVVDGTLSLSLRNGPLELITGEVA